MDKNAITLCLIAKNEEKNLKRCIDSIYNFIDKIVLVDTGSTDSTVEIAKSYEKCEVYHFKWIDDFAAARNYGLDFVKTPYFMWLDCDDVIMPKDLEILLNLKKDLYKYQIISMDYNYGFDNKDYLTGKPTLTLTRNRIFRTDLGCRWHDRIHEYLDVRGIPYKIEAKVTHTRVHSNGTRNLDIFKDMISKGEEFSDRSQYYCAKEFYYNGLFKEAKERLLDVIYNRNNWYEEKLQALQALIVIAKSENNKNDIKKYCFKSFEFVNIPRAEFIYEIANLHFNNNDMNSAIYWYNVAANTEIPKDASFVKPQYYQELPHLQLSVCYYKIGNLIKSMEENDIAYKYDPNHPSILYNKKFFEKIKQKNKKLV